MRVVHELILNRNYYEQAYANTIGPISIAIQNVSRNHTYSELYEVAALCNILSCQIQLICPAIGFSQIIANIANTTFGPIIHNPRHSVMILWSHTLNERDARSLNNGYWSPNHFTPILYDPVDVRLYSPENIPALKVRRFLNNAV